MTYEKFLEIATKYKRFKDWTFNDPITIGRNRGRGVYIDPSYPSTVMLSVDIGAANEVPLGDKEIPKHIAIKEVFKNNI